MIQDLQKLTIDDFSPLIDQTLWIRFEPQVRIAAQLIETKSFQNYSPLERQPFSMVLRTAQKNEYYSQAIFVVEHPSKGDLSLFLVPIGVDNQGVKYEVIFS